MGVNALCFSFLSPPALTAEAIAAAKQLSAVESWVDVTLITTYHTAPVQDEQLLTYLHNIRVIRIDHRGKWVLAIPRAAWKLAGCEDEQWARLAASACYNHRPDVLWSRSTPGPSHVAALHWHRRKSARVVPWVAQFSDPWAYTPLPPPGGVPQRTERRRRLDEGLVCREADNFIFPTADMAEAYTNRYPRLVGRVSVVPHCFDPSAFPPRSLAPRHRVRLSHIGTFYQLQAFQALLTACQGLDVDLRIVGNLEPEYLRAARESGVPCKITGPVGYFESLQEMVDADILLFVDPMRYQNMGEGSRDRHSIFLPSKIVDYLGSRRPIFGVTLEQGPVARLMNRFGFPTAAGGEQAHQVLSQALRDMSALAARASSNDYSDFTSDAIGQQLANILGVVVR